MRPLRSRTTNSSMGWILAGALAGMLLLVSAHAGATVLVQRYDFNEPQVVPSGKYDSVTMENTWAFGEPGEPILPKAGAQLLLPPGEEIVSVTVIPGDRVVLPGRYNVAPGQRQYPLSYAGAAVADEPLPEIYSSSAPFPGSLYADAKSGFLRGYQVATLALHPVEYLPAQGELAYYRSLEVEIVTASSSDVIAKTEEMIRHDEATLAKVSRIVDNPPAVDDYAAVVKTSPATRTLDPALEYKYLIVTGDAWAGYVADLQEFETSRGYKTGVFLRSWIVANYTGTDDAARIREFIKDAYQTWGIDYVLLVGDARDTNGIPHRGFYANGYGTIDSDIPADMYYGCLDGTWNTDGDANWGEPGEDDLYFEVGVGRACGDSQTEIQNFIVKTMRYQEDPIIGECDEALMAGELLWSDPTYGDDYKEEIRLGSSAHGYTTVGFPAGIQVGMLYDRQGTWTGAQLIAEMESGLNIVNHLGHCNVTYSMRLYNSDIPSFDNDGLVHSYNFVYSQGCYCGSIDNRNDGGSYETSDCFAEQFTCDDDGAVAVVMNSRYGWGQHLSTDGSSQYFDRQFFDAIFGERIYPLADVNDDSKMDNIWAMSYGANRWCYYELNVFGDPAMHLWTEDPVNLSCSYQPIVYIGSHEMIVTAEKPGGLLAGARVTIYTDDLSVYDTGVTDTFGEVILDPGASAPGTLHVVATAHDFLTFRGTAEIVPPEGPYVLFDEHVIHDGGGDQDGAADAGEVLGLDITLENVGVENATGVTGTITSSDPYVTIDEGTRSFPDILAGQFGTSLEPFGISVAGDTPDQHVISFAIQVNATEGQWSSNFQVLVAAPVLGCGQLVLTDIGNGDGGADPGEVLRLQVFLLNTGHTAAPALEGTLATSSPSVVINDGQATCPAFPLGGQGLMSTFEVEVLADCPDPTTLPFTVAITGPNGFAAQAAFNIDVGGWYDPAEANRGWTCGVSGDNATSGYWLRAEPVGTLENGNQVQPEYDHTADPGQLCFVTGNGTGGTSGENDVDNGRTTLLTPAFDLSDAISASVEYWRWYTNNLGNSPGLDTWYVDITSNGTTWVALEHTTTSNNAWAQYQFNITDYVALSDRVQLRFIAEDLSPGSLVEAAVDDFFLDAVFALPSGLTVDDVRQGYGIISFGPNPAARQSALVYRLARDAQVRIEVYDIGGRVVRTLADGKVEAGTHTLAFDGRDVNGHTLASGIYFLRMRTPEMLEVRQITMLK